MLFGVKLIEVPKLSALSGLDVASLFSNARHIAGDFWCFEGEIDAFDFPVDVAREGAINSTSTEDYNDKDFINKCSVVFGWDFAKEPPMWKILSN